MPEIIKTGMTPESKGMSLGFIAVVAFGLTLPVTRFIVPWFDPVFIGLGRACVAACLAIPILFFSRQPLASKAQLVKLIVVALGVVIGFPVLSAWSMQTVPASHGGVVLGILPLLTATASMLVSDERPSAGFWMVAITGSALVVVYSLLSGAGKFQFGDIILLLATISAAIGYAVGGQLSKEMGGWQVICWALAISLPFILIPAVLSAPDNVHAIPTSAYIGFIYLALVSQLVGFFIWYHGLAIGGVSRVSQTQLIQPFVTIFVSALLLREIISTETILFAFLVVMSVAIGKNMPVHKKAH